MKTVSFIVGLFTTAGLFLYFIDFLGEGSLFLLALLTGSISVAILTSFVILLVKIEEKRVQKGVFKVKTNEVAATYERREQNNNNLLTEKFLYLIASFVCIGYFLASFTSQSNGMSAEYVLHWRVFSLVALLVTSLLIFVYHRIKARQLNKFSL